MKARQVQKPVIPISLNSLYSTLLISFTKVLTLIFNGCSLLSLLYLRLLRLKLIQKIMLGYCTSCFFRCCGFLALMGCDKQWHWLGVCWRCLIFLNANTSLFLYSLLLAQPFTKVHYSLPSQVSLL